MVLSSKSKNESSSITQDLLQLVEYLEDISAVLENDHHSETDNCDQSENTSNTFSGVEYNINVVESDSEQLENIVGNVTRLLTQIGLTDHDFYQ